MLNLLSRRVYPESGDENFVASDHDSSDDSPGFCSSSSSSASTSTSPATSPLSACFPDDVHRSLDLVSANLTGPASDRLPVQISASVPTVHIEFISPSSNTRPTSTHIIDLSGHPVSGLSVPPSFPRNLRVETLGHDIGQAIPYVLFSSLLPLSSDYRSCFYVFINEDQVYSEATCLTLLSTPGSGAQGNAYVYGSSMIPGFWQKLCKTVGTWLLMRDVVKR